MCATPNAFGLNISGTAENHKSNMRIFENYTYIYLMKAKLNLTIDETLLTGVKNFAASKQVSISELVEIYFRNIIRPVKRKNIIDLVNQLKPPAIDADADLKKAYYEIKGGKHGF